MDPIKPERNSTIPADDQAPAASGISADAAEKPTVTPQAFGPTELPATKQPNKLSKLRLGKSKLILLVVAFLILLGGSAAAYFGYVVPNKPENIWKTALTNTGKGYDKLTDYATNYQTRSIKVDGKFKLSGAFAADGTVSGASDGKNGQGTETFSMAGLKLNIEARSIDSGGAYPDLYFKVDGLDGLGTLLGGANSELTKALNGLNGQWYVVDHSLFDQLSSAQGVKASPQANRSDVNELLKSLAGTNKKYLFTTDESKSVVVVKQNVGKETKDGKKVYHFKVAPNKANLKSYVTELCNDFKNSKLVSKTSSQAATAFDCKSTSVDSVDTSKTADVWVDLHTKLISAVRFSSQNDSANNYVELGQAYQGGSEYPFNIVFNTKSGKDTMQAKLTMTIDTKTDIVKLTGTLSASGSASESGSLDFTFAPNNSPVKVTKPTGAKSIVQLLNDLGIPSMFQSLNSANPVHNSSMPNLIVQ